MDHVRRSQLAYGGSAERYLELVGSALSEAIETADDLALLRAVVDSARHLDGVAVDAGCGTGRVARLLADRGLTAVGIDVAPRMVAIAASEHPDVPFAVGRLDALPIAPGCCSVVVCWYSIITTPPDGLGAIGGELRRALVEGGRALVAFQSGGGERVERPRAYGTDVDLTLHRHDADVVAAALRAAGLRIDDVTVRPAERAHEHGPQGFVTATAPDRGRPVRRRPAVG